MFILPQHTYLVTLHSELLKIRLKSYEDEFSMCTVLQIELTLNRVKSRLQIGE